MSVCHKLLLEISTGTTEAELKKTQEEKDKMMREKDDEINRLQMKIDGMEKDYERIVDVCFDELTVHLRMCCKLLYNQFQTGVTKAAMQT